MSRLIKVAAIVAIAVATLAARQVTMHSADGVASLGAQASTMVPIEMMRKAGPLPQTEVESYF